MSILQAFAAGFRRAMAERKLMFLLYSVNVIMAVPLALAWRSALQAGFGSSMDSASLMDGLDLSIMAEFMAHHGDGIRSIISQILWTTLLYTTISTFLAGGILTVIRARQEPFTAPSFFAGCGTYFFRFLRLAILFVIVLLIVLVLVAAIAGGIVVTISDNAQSELTAYWGWIAYALLLLLPAMVILMVADYARIIVVVHNERSMLRTAWRSTKLVFRYLPKTLGLQMLMILIPVALFASVLWLDLIIGMSSDLTIVVMFIIQQLYVLSKMWTKVFFYSGELSLYHGLQPFGSQNSEPAAAAPGTQSVPT